MSIYFIQAGENGPIKIGKTNGDAKDRLANLQIGNHEELKLLWVYHGDEYGEIEDSAGNILCSLAYNKAVKQNANTPT